MKQNKRKVCVIERANYIVFLENVCGLTFAHIDVKKWGRDTLKMCRLDLEMLLSIRKSPIFVSANSINRKLVKFSQMLGFEYQSESLKEDGTYDIFLRKDYH